ncbi:hypothetical protein SDC9_206789 [bioreactor metagenome]|uniref:Uncharacterized protein n=1 Tax=bioreactor metagenome TaxID=1076179 RepID=A0A645J626_9ZZZZ
MRQLQQPVQRIIELLLFTAKTAAQHIEQQLVPTEHPFTVLLLFVFFRDVADISAYTEASVQHAHREIYRSEILVVP